MSISNTVADVRRYYVSKCTFGINEWKPKFCLLDYTGTYLFICKGVIIIDRLDDYIKLDGG